MNLEYIQNRIDALSMEFNAAKRQVQSELVQLKQAKRHLSDVQQAQGIAQNIAMEVERTAHKNISNVVSSCLKTVFDDDFTFDIIFERKRGRTEAKLTLKHKGQAMPDALDNASGGTLDICGFALRLACLLLQKPSTRKILVLDEGFKFVSKEYRERIVAMITKLSEDLNMQFIFVTHISELECGTIIRL